MLAAIFVKFLRSFPPSFYYAISDVVRAWLYYVMAYRKGIVKEHISQAFPTKSKDEVKAITKKFYRNFTDALVETLVCSNFDKSDWERRVEIKNLHVLKDVLDKGTPIILISGHTANWEWPAFAINSSIDYPFEFLYKPIKNTFFSELVMATRSKHGGVPIDKAKAMREMVKRRKVPRVVGFITDQIPAIGTEKKWINFLNKDSAFYVGAERSANAFQYPVFYVESIRKKRGYYSIEFTQISNPPYEKGKDYQITEKFASLLEKTIAKNPSDYLWTHKRWKYSKQEEQEHLKSL